jgi:hypothetical protein
VAKHTGDGGGKMPTFVSTEKQRIERANQVFLRLKKDIHDRNAQPSERDVVEAARGARWLREIIERCPREWNRAYKDALIASELPGEDKAYLREGVKQAKDFASFILGYLRKLEEPSTNGRQARELGTEMSRQELACGVVAGLMAGGVALGNYFYFGFAVGMSRKAQCW